MNSHETNVEDVLETLLSAFQDNGMAAFMDETYKEGDGDVDTIESIMNMSQSSVDDQLRSHQRSQSPSSNSSYNDDLDAREEFTENGNDDNKRSNETNSRYMHPLKLSTIPRMKRKRPGFNSSGEKWNDDMATHLAGEIREYEDNEHSSSKFRSTSSSNPSFDVSSSSSSSAASSSAASVSWETKFKVSNAPTLSLTSSPSSILSVSTVPAVPSSSSSFYQPASHTRVRHKHHNSEQFSTHKLATNAENVLDVLISHQNHSSSQRRRMKDQNTKDMMINMNGTRSLAPTHCRKKLSNATTSRSKSGLIDGLDEHVSVMIYNYLHQCQVHRYHPTFDYIHNILLNAHVRKNQLQKESSSMSEFMHKTVDQKVAPVPTHTSKSSRTKLTSKPSQLVRELIPNMLRTLVTQLVVQLWTCSQSTPYMEITKRPTDVFRHFAAGVLFGMRRGMKMDDGTIIVPHSRSIEQTLQLSNTVPRGTLAHEIHLQAHKGTSTLQRCLGSLGDDDTRRRVYNPAILIATELQQKLNSHSSVE